MRGRTPTKAKRLSGDWRSRADAGSTPGQARSANGGSKLPHSTGGTRLHEADGVQVAKYVCRAQRACPYGKRRWALARSALTVEERFLDRVSGASRKTKGAGHSARNDDAGATAVISRGIRRPHAGQGALAVRESPAVHGDSSDGTPKYDDGANGKGARDDGANREPVPGPSPACASEEVNRG